MLEVGKIVNTHGLRGEVKVITWTDCPEVFEDIEYVYIKRRGEEKKLTLSGVKYQKNNIIVKFNEINSIEEAEGYKNSVLLAEREMLGPLPEGVYYIADLIGCTVYDETTGEIGKVSDVFNTGANDIYEIKREGKRAVLVPVIDGVIKKVDIKNKRIDISMPEGLDEI